MAPTGYSPDCLGRDFDGGCNDPGRKVMENLSERSANDIHVDFRPYRKTAARARLGQPSTSRRRSWQAPGS